MPATRGHGLAPGLAVIAAPLVAVALLWIVLPFTAPSMAPPADTTGETATAADRPPVGTDVADVSGSASGSDTREPSRMVRDVAVPEHAGAGSAGDRVGTAAMAGSGTGIPDQPTSPPLDPFGLVTSPESSRMAYPVHAGAESPIGTPVPSATSVRPDSALAGSDTLADRLLEAALDDGSAESAGKVGVEFTTAPLPGVRYLPIPAELEPLATVYAHLLASGGCAECIIKWQHQESGEIVGLAPVQLEVGRWRTFPITPAAGWNIGTYALSVFAADTPNRLIGSSALVVSDNTAAPVPAGAQVEFIQSLMEQGLAVPKSN